MSQHTFGRRKVRALDPAVREEVCDHAHMPFRGAIPCTGPRACTMCGATEYDLREEQTPPDLAEHKFNERLDTL
jgi:hypothetical protein